MRKAIMALEGLEEVTEEVVDTPEETLNNTEVIETVQCPIHDPEEIIQNDFMEINADENYADDVSEASDEAIETATTLESISNILKASPTGIAPNGVKVLTTAIEHLCSRVGHAKPIVPAMEAFGSTSNKLQGTKDLVVTLEGIGSDLWEAIKKTFFKMVNFFKDMFNKLFGIEKKIEDGIKSSISKVEDLENEVKTGKPAVATESIALEDASNYDLEKPLTLEPSTFGAYLGNDTKGLHQYVDSLRLLDHAILDTLKHTSEDFDWSGLNVGPSSSSLFKAPSTPEQKEFFKNKVPFSNVDVKVIPLPFKKGFIWKVEGASFQHTKDYVEMLEVSAGVERQNYSYDLDEIECLGLTNIKYILNKLKSDIEENGKNTHTVASAIIKAINEKSKDLETSINSIKDDENNDVLKESKAKFAKARESLNALKNIETGYWQFKNQTTVKIKEYCDASVATRRRDYKEFNTV